MAVTTTPQRAPTTGAATAVGGATRKRGGKVSRSKAPRAPLTPCKLAEKAREKARADEELLRGREACVNNLRQSWEIVFEKYGDDFEGCADVIDLETGEIIVDNGDLRGMDSESDGEEEEGKKFRWGELLAGDPPPKEDNQKNPAKRKRGESEEVGPNKNAKLGSIECEHCRHNPIPGCSMCPPLSFSAINDSLSVPTWSREEEQLLPPPIPSLPPVEPVSTPARPPQGMLVSEPAPSPSPKKQASPAAPLHSPERPASATVVLSSRELRSQSARSPSPGKGASDLSPPSPGKQTPVLATLSPSSQISEPIMPPVRVPRSASVRSPSPKKQTPVPSPPPPRKQTPTPAASSPSKRILDQAASSPMEPRPSQPPPASPKQSVVVSASSLSQKKGISSPVVSPQREQTPAPIPSSPPAATACPPSPVAVSDTIPTLISSPISLPNTGNLMLAPSIPSQPSMTPQAQPNWATSSPANCMSFGLGNRRRKSAIADFPDGEIDELSSPYAPSPYRGLSSALRTFTPKSKLKALIVARRLYRTPSKTSMKRSHPSSSLHEDLEDELQSPSAPTLARVSTPLTPKITSIHLHNTASSSPISGKQSSILNAGRGKFLPSVEKIGPKESSLQVGQSSSVHVSRDRRLTSAGVVVPKRITVAPRKASRPANPWAVTPDDPFYNPKWDDEHPDGTPAVFPKPLPATPFFAQSNPLVSTSTTPIASKKPARLTTAPIRHSRTGTPRSSVGASEKAIKKPLPAPGWTATPARKGSGVLDYLEELGSRPSFSVVVSPRHTPAKLNNGNTTAPSARRPQRNQNPSPSTPEVLETPIMKMKVGKCGDDGYTCGKRFCFDCLRD